MDFHKTQEHYLGWPKFKSNGGLANIEVFRMQAFDYTFKNNALKSNGEKTDPDEIEREYQNLFKPKEEIENRPVRVKTDWRGQLTRAE